MGNEEREKGRGKRVPDSKKVPTPRGKERGREPKNARDISQSRLLFFAGAGGEAGALQREKETASADWGLAPRLLTRVNSRKGFWFVSDICLRP